MRNGTIVMGPSGDRAISWDDADSEKMISYIQSKMDAGWMFFIVERGSIERWKPLKSAEDARATKSVVMVEPELAAAVETGVALVSEAKGATEVAIAEATKNWKYRRTAMPARARSGNVPTGRFVVPTVQEVAEFVQTVARGQRDAVEAIA